MLCTQIEGSFVQGIGYYLTEQIKWDENGVLLTNGTWTYKPPTIDNIPQKFNVELLNSAVDSSRILSSKSEYGFLRFPSFSELE